MLYPRPIALRSMLLSSNSACIGSVCARQSLCLFATCNSCHLRSPSLHAVRLDYVLFSVFLHATIGRGCEILACGHHDGQGSQGKQAWSSVWGMAKMMTKVGPSPTPFLHPSPSRSDEGLAHGHFPRSLPPPLLFVKASCPTHSLPTLTSENPETNF